MDKKMPRKYEEKKVKKEEKNNKINSKKIKIEID